jgi:hypothetical protein
MTQHPCGCTIDDGDIVLCAEAMGLLDLSVKLIWRCVELDGSSPLVERLSQEATDAYYAHFPEEEEEAKSGERP